MKETNDRLEATIAAIQALDMLPKGGLTKIQWQVMRSLRRNGVLSESFLKHMRYQHPFFDSATMPVMIARGLITTYPFAITADGLILMRHLELVARDDHWKRQRRLT